MHYVEITVTWLTKDIGGELIFNCNFSPKTLPHLSRLLLFYKDMLNAWQKILSHTPLSKNEVENEIIWKNKFVTVERKSVFYWLWSEAGVKYINDLITDADVNVMTFMFLSILVALKHTFAVFRASKHYCYELEKETQE